MNLELEASEKKYMKTKMSKKNLAPDLLPEVMGFRGCLLSVSDTMITCNIN